MASEENTTSVYFSGRSSSLQKNSGTDSKNNGSKRLKLGNGSKSIAEPVVGLQRYRDDFYNVPCEDLAKKLLGKVLVRRLGDVVLKGKIVETECYLGGEDKASHSYGGKVTERNKPMYMKPGTAYVYFTYGMYHCFNISSMEPGSCVLIRSIEPIEGSQQMLHLRRTKKKKKEGTDSSNCLSKDLKTTEICNGPAKLCISFDIRKENCNTRDLSTWDGMWIERDGVELDVELHSIVSCPRIGIDSAGTEWAQKPLRFYILNNKFVSRRNIAAEKQHLKPQIFRMIIEHVIGV